MAPGGRAKFGLETIPPPRQQERTAATDALNNVRDTDGQVARLRDDLDPSQWVFVGVAAGRSVKAESGCFRSPESDEWCCLEMIVRIQRDGDEHLLVA